MSQPERLGAGRYSENGGGVDSPPHEGLGRQGSVARYPAVVPSEILTYMRLRGTISGALQSNTGDSGVGHRSLVDCYNIVRAEVMRLIGGDVEIEFMRLFPEELTPAPSFSTNDPEMLFQRQGMAGEAKVCLGKLEGWLAGLIEGLQWTDQTKIDAHTDAEYDTRTQKDYLPLRARVTVPRFGQRRGPPTGPG